MVRYDTLDTWLGSMLVGISSGLDSYVWSGMQEDN